MFPFPHGYRRDAIYIIIDLNSAYWVERIVIHNRQDACRERAKSVAVSLSSDGIDYQSIFSPPENEWVIFGVANEALTVEVDQAALVRFVKLYLREKNFFHLDCVQVYARSFLL